MQFRLPVYPSEMPKFGEVLSALHSKLVKQYTPRWVVFPHHRNHQACTVKTLTREHINRRKEIAGRRKDLTVDGGGGGWGGQGRTDGRTPE